MKTPLTILFILLLTITCYSQLDFVRNHHVQVSNIDGMLQNAWAGGINSGQVSRIDLNGDGILDLFIFDKVGNRVLPFINTNSSPGTIDYKHHFEYKDIFPAMSGWVLLRDFNCDGLVDIFTNNFNGIMVYENVSVGGELAFELRTEAIFSSYNYSGTPFNAPMYCLSVDIPSIVDLDEDGDLDIVTWADNNVTIFYYENLGADIGNCDSLAFQLGNRCYGVLSEGTESSHIYIGDSATCDFNVMNPTRHMDFNNKHTVHAGGTLLNIDLDQNGVKDLIVSDVTDHSMTSIDLVPNSELIDSAISVTPNFPATNNATVAIDMALFPAAYYEDIDNDGVKDLFSSPNLTSGTRDNNSLWYYHNSGENDLPVFDFVEEDFLQKTMIDIGRGALPTLVDYNNDGLMDLVIANQKAYISETNQPSKLVLYKNIGDANFPAFELVDSNFLDIASLGLSQVYPAFGDLDGDTDMDIILGDKEGKLYQFENTAPIGSIANWVFNPLPVVDADGESIDIGKNATPQLFDMDGNGTLDLVIGEENGNINYFENNGTLNTYSFIFIEDTIGDVVADNFLGIKGSSVPHLWRDSNNNIQLMVGTETGILTHYTDIAANIGGTFSLVTQSVENINEGTYSAPILYDFTNDGKVDMIIGNIGGGLAFYEGGTTMTVGVSNNNVPSTITLTLYPNPVDNTLRINFDHFYNSDNIITIYSTTGQLVHQETNFHSGKAILLHNLDAGVYRVVIQKGNQSISSSFIKL